VAANAKTYFGEKT
jgi:hypothetical protein